LLLLLPIIVVFLNISFVIVNSSLRSTGESSLIGSVLMILHQELIHSSLLIQRILRSLAVDRCLRWLVSWRHLRSLIRVGSLIVVLSWSCLMVIFNFILHLNLFVIARWRILGADMNCRQVFLLAVHLIKVFIDMRKNLGAVFRTDIGNVTLIIAAILVKLLNLASCNRILQFKVHL
jgi:hypothetical protein